jgi:hypothetical protein
VLNQKQFKSRAQRFAREVQIAVRTAEMLPVEHTVTARPIKQSFDSLTALQRDNGDVTLGFVNNRVMLNRLLTTIPKLSELENSFLKRGIGAVRFKAGLTFRQYTRLISLLAVPLKTVEAQGGAKKFLAQYSFDGIHLFPVSANQGRTTGGDTVIDMDEEAFLLSRDGASTHLGISSEWLAMFFESANLETPSGMGGPADIMRRITPTIEAALVKNEGNPQQAYLALAEILRGVTPDVAMSAFSGRHAPSSSAKPEEMAAELMEETAMRWAAKQFASIPGGADAYVVEGEVIRVLARSLQATRMAEGLAAKLAVMFEEYGFPKHTHEKVQEELQWVATAPEEKHQQLLKVERFGHLEFRRLLDHLREQLGKANIAEATALAIHYLKFLDRAAHEIQPEELSRTGDLLQVMESVRTDFARPIAERLVETLQCEKLQGFRHFQLINLLAQVGKSAGCYEEFDIVQMVGVAIEQSLGRDQAAHSNCCFKALRELVAPNALERFVERYLQNKNDPALPRNIASMLRWTGAHGIGTLLSLLEGEKAAGRRMALIRLISRSGNMGVDVTRERLHDERWYVVRNACTILAELNDPELLEHLLPVLAHPDVRVQKAAINAIVNSRSPERGQALAAGLQYLRDEALLQALDEIAFLKDPATAPELEKFIRSNSAQTRLVEKGFQVLLVFPVEQIAENVVRIITELSGNPAFEIAVATIKRSRPEIRESLMKIAGDSKQPALRSLSASAGKSK